MVTKDIVTKINEGLSLNDWDLDFIRMMWTADRLERSEKYNSYRCPKCFTSLYSDSGNFCSQCGKKLNKKWNNYDNHIKLVH